ncbi:hypothetical protein CPB97_008815 [Podila verticillata]|nr:hypothetical protein CPB97_008815 [Podila verticillata]
MTPPDDPWHVLNQLDFSPPTIPPSLLAKDLHHGSPSCTTVLMVHLHARILYEVNDKELKRTWIFSQDILSFIFAHETSLSQPYPTVIVATVDGRIWSIMGQEAPLPPLSQSSSTPVKDNKVKQEPELIVIDEEEDEIELWNDEEGIVQQLLMDVDFDTAPKKRQRTQSPPVMEKKSDIQKTSYTVVHVEAPKDLLGSEENVTNMVFALGGLLIFRENSDPILWTSVGWKSNTPIKRVLHFDQPLSHITTLLASTLTPGKARKGSRALYVGTKPGHVYSVVTLDDESNLKKEEKKVLDTNLEHLDSREEQHVLYAKGVQRMLDIQEPIASMFLSDDLSVLVVVGSSGRVFEADLGETQTNVRKPCAFQIGTPIRHAFSTGAWYFLSVGGQIYRKGSEELYRIETPPILAMTRTPNNKIYGLNIAGQVLEFSNELDRYFRPVSTLAIREGISTSLSELEQVSEEIKSLEQQCQLENQRIATFNKIVHELQQYVMAQSQEETPTPPVDITTTTFVQPVLMGREQRRYTVRLTITSAIDLDWSVGWSVGICLSPAPWSCSHEEDDQPPKTGIYQEDFASLETLSRQSPYTVDLEVDLKRMRLPLTMSVGLYYLEPVTTDESQATYQHNPPLSAHFFVCEMELDALCFAEPVVDEKRRQPPMSLSTMTKELWEGFGDCQVCRDEQMMATTLAPLMVPLDPDISVDQCLSALVVDGLPRDKALGILQSGNKAVMTISEDCLPLSGRISMEGSQGVPQPDLAIVWVVLEVGEASGEVSMAVKGKDPRRVVTVHQALEKRIKMLFE